LGESERRAAGSSRPIALQSADAAQAIGAFAVIAVARSMRPDVPE